MIWKVTLNGTLADFDEAAQAAAKAALVVTFNQPSITAEHITLTVEAGSIIVTGEVRLEDPSVDFTALSTTVTDLFYNETAMTATFGLPLISVDTQPTLSYASKPPAAPPPPSPPSPTPPAQPSDESDSSDDDDFPLWIIIVAAGVGGCLVLALLIFLCVFCMRKRHKKAVQPLANTDANANSPAAAASASVPTARRSKSKKAAQPPAAEAAQTIYQQNAANPAAGLTQGEFAAADSQLRGGAAAQLPGGRPEESETARCLATMAAASGGAGATPFSAQVEAPLAPLAPLQGPAGGAGAGGGGLRPLAPPLTPLGGAAAGGAPGLRPLAPLGSVGGAGGGGRGLAPLRPLGS